MLSLIHIFFLHHLPQGGIAEHHKGRDLLLSGQPLALSIEGIQQLYVNLAQLTCHRLCAARLQMCIRDSVFTVAC